MQLRGFVSFSSTFRFPWKQVGAVSCVALSCAASLMAQQAQKPYKGGGGKAEVPGMRVPFQAGPLDESGHVYQVIPPQNVISVPLHMTDETLKAKQAATSGTAVPSTKPLARELTSAESSAFHTSQTKIKSFSLQRAGQAQAVSTAPTAGARPGPVSLARTISGVGGRRNAPTFLGVGFTGFIPPDGGVAAGPFNVVGVVNATIQVFDKNGNLLSSQDLGTFFNGVTGASDFVFDPSVIYDADIGRFWVLAASAHDSTSSDPGNRSSLLIAVSNSSDVTAGGWTVFSLDATINGNGSDGDRNACDFPHFGVDAQAIYFSCNMFSFPFFGGTSFQYAKVRILTKSQFTNGPCCSWWDFWDFRERFLNLFHSSTVRPAIMHFASPSDGEYLVNAEGDGGTLKVRRIRNAQNCCNGVGPDLDDNDQGVGGFSPPPGANQPGTAIQIDTGDDRLLYATWQFGHLTTGQNLACNPGDGNHACLGFTEIDVSSYPNMSNVSDFAFGVQGKDLYFPYVEQNVNADKTMVYTQSDGSSTFAGAYYRGIPNPNVCTNCIDGEGLLHLGENTYINLDSNGQNRWGDYHGAGADPDLLGVWIEGEYATSTGFTWATAIGATLNNYAPSPAFSNNPLGFGIDGLFTTNTQQELIFNNGNATLSITSVSVSGDPDFTIAFDGCSFHAVQPGSFCTVTGQFRPTGVGPKFGSLNVAFNNTSVSASLLGTGAKDASRTVLTSSRNPSVVGTPVTFTAVVSAANGIPVVTTGSVVFKDGATTLGTVGLKAGRATLTTSTLTAGNHSTTASYGGDNTFTASVGAVTQSVRTTTTTTLTASVNPSVIGQPVVLTARVLPATATGTVTFKNGAAVLGTSTLALGKTTLTNSSLTVGTHSITATYNGSGMFLTSTSPALPHTVNKGATHITVLSSASTSVFSQPVTFTATVAAAAPAAGVPTGAVTFKDGAVNLGTGTLAAGKAKFTTSSLAPGRHSVTAVYGGSTTFNSGTSGAVQQTVNKATTTTKVSSSANPSTLGQAVTFTMTVSVNAPATANPTGSVTLQDGALSLGTLPLVNGKASIPTASLTRGRHAIRAVYSGNVHDVGSTSATLTQTVN